MIPAVRMRSLLYVPGNRPRMIDRALGWGEFTAPALDVAVLDLEDGTPLAEKGTARSLVRAALPRPSNGRRGPLRYVRLNQLGGDLFEQDLDATVVHGLSGVVVPKVESADSISDLSARLDNLEHERGLDDQSIRIIASVESALGLVRGFQIAGASTRMQGLLLGGEDYALDLGLPADRSAEAADLLFARSWLVNSAVAAGSLAFDGVWTTVKDLEGLRRETLQARRLGFAGKSAMHPDHIELINEVFSPSAAELAHAHRVLLAFQEAEARGQGAVALDGKMLDRPIVERARRMLEQLDQPGG